MWDWSLGRKYAMEHRLLCAGRKLGELLLSSHPEGVHVSLALQGGRGRGRKE
jgi:hypothetical protein